MQKIRFEDWLNESEPEINIFFSVNETDFKIQEQTLLNRKWVLHKFRGPEDRYGEILVRDGQIVWIYGPFSCGTRPNVKIFKYRMVEDLVDDKFAVGDSGYRHVNVRLPIMFVLQSSLFMLESGRCRKRAMHD